MDRNNIEKIAKNPEDRVLLAKVWDKINAGIQKNIPANTCFLSLRELDMSRFLFGQLDGLHAFGGYPAAERQMLIYLPEYMEESALYGEDSPLVCLRATFYEGDTPSHRDFLGALMGAGIGRETVGDICVGEGYCDFFVLSDIAPHLLRDFESAGRTKVKLSPMPLSEFAQPEEKTESFYDTLPSLRLDAVIAAGFRISRTRAGEYILSGKAAIDGLPCEKPDKAVDEGAAISVRGLGKVKLAAIRGKTKKDRIGVEILRYM